MYEMLLSPGSSFGDEWRREAGVTHLPSKNGVPSQTVGARPSNSANHPKRDNEKSGKDAGRWEPAIHEIARFLDLEDDWDGGGAKVPSRELLESAIGLAYYFSEQKDVSPPSRVVPGVDGSVVFEWQNPDGTCLELEVVRPFFSEAMLVEPGKPAKHWTLPSAAKLVPPMPV